MDVRASGDAQGAFLDSDSLLKILSLGSSHGGAHVAEMMRGALMSPIEDLYSRPSKKFRSELVRVGFMLGRKREGALNHVEENLVSVGAQVIEDLHSGSLVVDDIQDGSKYRRGAPALHLKFGVPVALNAGNWLYFYPMQRIRDLKLPPTTELRLYQLCHESLLRAHFGQALDVGVAIDEIDQRMVSETCMASLELKSGALMSLAIQTGAVLAEADEAKTLGYGNFGRRLGISLQMFDDIGNLKPAPKLELSRQYEDLMLKRPSWLWAVVAESYSSELYGEFIKAVQRLPDVSFLNPWLEIHNLASIAKEKARGFLDAAMNDLERENPRAGVMTGLRDFSDKLVHAYG